MSARGILSYIKKGRLLLLLWTVLLILCFLPLYLLLPAPLSYTGSLTLSQAETKGPTQFLPLLTMSVLDVKIKGGNQEVYLYITNSMEPKANSTRNLVFGRITMYGEYHLEWTPSQIYDTYKFNFHNDMGDVNQKFVTYTLRVYPYGTILFAFGIFSLLVWIVKIVRYKQRSR